MKAQELSSNVAQTNEKHCETAGQSEQTAINPLDVKAGAQVPTPPDPPVLDGGSRAWLQVLGSFLVFGNIWGFTFAFGSFQSYYELSYLEGVSASTISWIGTVSSALLIVIGVFSGPLFDLGFYRGMLFAGAAIGTFSVMMLSLCTQYWQILLSQGICLGLGNGLLYLPGLALVGRSFQHRRAIAMGITTSGAPVGGIIYTVIFQQLIEKVGFAWTVRVMGFVMLSSYLISFPLLLWGASNFGNIGSGTTRKLFDKKALKDLPFWSYTFANFFIFCGYLVPFYFIASYGQVELGMSRSFALNTLVIAQASSVVGRMVAALAAHHFGVMIPWVICGLFSGMFCLIWIAVHNIGGFVTFAALFGAFSGPLIPLPPSIFPVVCPDPKVLGTRLGMAQGIGAVASLIGSPIAGALIRPNSGGHGQGYLGLQLYSGLVMIFGGLQLIGLWFVLSRRGEKKRLI